MATNDVDRLKALANFADQICTLAEDGEEARRRISQLIGRAEQEIKTKSLEIQLQQSHIALLKHLESFLARPMETPGQFRLNEAERGGPRAIAADGQ